MRERLAELGLAPVSGLPSAPARAAAEASAALSDLMADVEAAIVAQLVDRVARVHAATPFSVLTVTGGVAANTLVRERLPA